ncbi:MAG: alpha-ketoacid dehydrogenase subunit beta [Dehalococcoidia bacterium]|nr:MAG: alpha-ketoacid dehydrogenase subunit beta [Dehalococcoidia bacterium]
MRPIIYLMALNEALQQEMERDPTVFVTGEDVGQHPPMGVTLGMLQKFGPQRVVDTPISESAILGLAVGAAAAGLRPVVEIMFLDFLFVAFDQVINQMAKMRYMFGGKAKLPIVVRCPCGGGYQMAAQHSQSLEAMLCHIPGLKVVMPATPYNAKGLLTAAIRDDNPVFCLEHKKCYTMAGDVPQEQYELPLGIAEVKRPGSDVTIVATSYMVHEALKAAEELAGRGIEAEVIDPRTLLPLDMDTILKSVRKTHRVVVVHEAVKFCGFGAEIAAQVAEAAFDALEAPPLRVAAPFCPVPFSAPLEEAYLPNAQNIVEAVSSVTPAKA